MLSAWFRSRVAAPCWLAISTILILTILITTGQTAAVGPGTERFQRTWSRTDQPVLDGLIPRTWMWGPQANYELMQEEYEDAPGGHRTVQYFDKARMEDNSYRADDAPWDVTNGLLVVELVTGNMQTGDDRFEDRSPAQVNVAGDADDPTGPTYATFGGLLDTEPRAIGITINDRVDRDGNISVDTSLAAQGVTVGHIDEVTAHAIATPFWEFMNSSGTVYEDGEVITDRLFENAYFATGRPITEAYWANVKVAGTYRDVLMQCFERRCLTYTPGNPDGFVVEAGNVGLHYYTWRYGDSQPTATPAETTEPTVTTTIEPTSTAEPSATPTATSTAEPTATETPAPPATEYEFLTKWGAKTLRIVLGEPSMAATAPNGDIYVTNTATNQILRFAPNGQLITAWGSAGTNTGQFDRPIGITVDREGNVFVADYGNHRIQKFDPNGAFILTWGSEGVDQGQFKFPYGVAAGPDGTVYVSEAGNNRVQRFWGNGLFILTWGGLGSNPGQFVSPHGIAVNGSLVYVADSDNNRVQVFNVEGAIQGSLGQSGDGPGQLSLPLGLTVAGDGSVYVSDIGNDRVQVFTIKPVIAPAETRALAAIEYEYAGTVGDPGQFNNPLGLGFDGKGRLMVADASNNSIRFFVNNSITPQPGPFTLVDTWVDDTRGRFLLPGDMAQGNDGRIYVVNIQDITASGFTGQIQIFKPDGGYLDQWRDILASGLAFDSQGNLFLHNVQLGRIEKYSPDGELLDGWGPAIPLNPADFRWKNIAIDAENNLYILDSFASTIQKYRSDGTYLGAWGAPGNQPGQLDNPSGIAVYQSRVYVADSDNSRVQVFDLEGKVLLQWGSQGDADGQFSDGLNAIAVDSDGYVYVSDPGSNRIQKFTPDGEFLAKWGSEGITDGAFRTPGAVVVSPSGDVYVTDTGGSRIQVFRPVN